MNDNELIDELMGADASNPQEAAELSKAAAKAKADPLQVPKRAKTKASDKIKAEGYSITVDGLYTVAATDAPGRKVKKNYSLTVVLPSLDSALSVIKNKLLDKMLRAKYPGYVTYLTHEIVDVKALSTEAAPSNNCLLYTSPSPRD